MSREAGNYDLILTGCPPDFSSVARNAIAESDYRIIPAKPGYLSSLGVNSHINAGALGNSLHDGEHTEG
ncbi:MAG: AAA family ATPase [Synergistaceae bacterium]|nr:AAA family ATPase [Synergistaceae bacterium]MBQ7169800.1 AAA family ATPase [Synergistaceae bacterium]